MEVYFGDGAKNGPVNLYTDYTWKGEIQLITIKEHIESEIVEKKSKFIANIYFVENVEEAESKIKETKKKYYDARHNCYAYRILEEKEIYEKSCDDGEPSGTAGDPMLTILQQNGLVNVLAIVTRYFGGILLGTGGLVRSYSNSVINAINSAEIFNIQRGTLYNVQIDYENFRKLEYYTKINNIKISEIKYQENITCNLEVVDLFKNQFIEDIQNEKINIKNITTMQENINIII